MAWRLPAHLRPPMTDNYSREALLWDATIDICKLPVSMGFQFGWDEEERVPQQDAFSLVIPPRDGAAPLPQLACAFRRQSHPYFILADEDSRRSWNTWVRRFIEGQLRCPG